MSAFLARTLEIVQRPSNRSIFAGLPGEIHGSRSSEDRFVEQVVDLELEPSRTMKSVSVLQFETDHRQHSVLPLTVVIPR